MKQPTQQPGNLALSPRNIRRLVTERGSLRGQLLRGVMGNGGVNGLSMLLRFLVSVVLARLIGAEGLGAYSFAIAIVGVVAIPVQLGFPQFVVRYCAIYMRRGDTALMKGLLYSVGLIVLGMAVLALVVSIPLVEYLVREDGVVASATLLWAFALLPWSGLSAIGSSALRGLGFVTLGQFAGQVVRPLCFVVIIGVGLLAGWQMNATIAVKYNVVAALAASLIAISLLVRARPPGFFSTSPKFEVHHWIRGALPFMVLAGVNVVMQQIDLIMVGMLTTARDVGVYSVVSRIATLVPVGLLVINPVIAPQIARFHDAGDVASLQRLVTYAARASLLLALPFFVFLVLGGGWVLSTVYGHSFSYGNQALVILLIGQLFNAAMGSVGLILNMTGNAWYSASGLGFAAGTNIALNLALIPPYGIVGAAMATTVSLCMWNTLLAIGVYRRLNVISTAFLWR